VQPTRIFAAPVPLDDTPFIADWYDRSQPIALNADHSELRLGHAAKLCL
jgi:hypothetical protein